VAPASAEPGGPVRGPARNVKLVLAYDGSGFAGWQRQANARTVQGVLEETIARVTGERVTVNGAGRTDAGVHACGQVANFRTTSRLSADHLQRALNALLPPSVAVVQAEEVPAEFHARFGAVGKHYRYTLSLGPVRPVFDRERVLHVRAHLSLPAMRRAARPLVGEHDFAAFTKQADEAKSTVRHIDDVHIRRNGSRVLVDITGSGFLYGMVRAIVGTLLEVGRGKLTPAALADILASCDRRRAGPTAPAHGLCLMSVRYPEEARPRRRRTPKASEPLGDTRCPGSRKGEGRASPAENGGGLVSKPTRARQRRPRTGSSARGRRKGRGT
jgi:tRNA pseudouridine38-40 synthase